MSRRGRAFSTPGAATCQPATAPRATSALARPEHPPRARGRGRASLVAVVLATRLGLTAEASAQGQPWLADRRFGTGIGVRLGDFELHPGVAGELGYDTNYFQGSGTVTTEGEAVPIDPEYRPMTPGGASFGATGLVVEPLVGSFRFRLTPSLVLKTLGEQRSAHAGTPGAAPKVKLEAFAALSYNELVATDSTYREALSDERFVSADLGLAADFMPRQVWGVGLELNYNRAVQPVNDPAVPPAFDRSTFRGGAKLEWRPNGGLVDYDLGYRLTYVLFENAVFSNFNNAYHALSLNGRWRFLPRTAIVHHAELGYLVYPQSNGVTQGGNPVSTQLGINGLVTSHMAASATAGWKVLFFDEGPEFDGFIGTLELTWYPAPRADLDAKAAAVGLSSITLGARRDATNAYLGNYAASHLIYAKGTYFVAGNKLFSLDAGFDHIRRPESYFSNGTRQSAAFSENRVNVTAFGEYRTSDTFAVNATLRYSAALSSRLVPVSADVSEIPLAYDELAFDRVELWLGVRWFL